MEVEFELDGVCMLWMEEPVAELELEWAMSKDGEREEEGDAETEEKGESEPAGLSLSVSELEAPAQLYGTLINLDLVSERGGAW